MPAAPPSAADLPGVAPIAPPAAPPITPPGAQESGSASAARADVSPPGERAPESIVDAQLSSVELLGMRLAACSEPELLDMLFGALARRRGGWLVTANLDFLRRFHQDPRMQALYSQADVRVADGMPLVWGAWLRGTPVPERIAGSSLMRPLAERASREGRRVYFLGGNTGTAEAAARVLSAEYPGLLVAGCASPWLPAEPDDAAVEPWRQALTEAQPDIVLVALGSPKQEWLISKLRRSLPGCWFIGVGMSFSFTTGEMPRAPIWMQRSGLEWVHRLVSEPRRLGKRYLWHDAPFGVVLLGRCLLDRVRQR